VKLGLLLLGTVLFLACENKSKTEAAEFFERGNYHFKKNETERALELFTEAIEKVEDFADAFNNRGLCYEKLGNIEKASSDYRKAVELDDSFDAAKLNLASAYIQTGELRSSEELLNKLAPSYADSATFYDLRGKYYLESYEPESAESDFERSLKLRPNNMETETNLGFAHYKQQEFKKAENKFLKVLSNVPSFAFASNNLSATYAQLGYWEKALEYSQKTMEEVPNEVLFINTHTLNLIENNRLNEAVEFSIRALKLDPFNPYALRNSGILTAKGEDPRKAIAELEEVEAKNPDVEFIYYYLGNLYHNQGDITKACKSFKRGALLGDLRSKVEASKCL
jgi:tetratricopeptide (TPR) repeat protein